MTHQLPNETMNRFAIAASELLRHPLDPEFAADAASAIFMAGPMLDPAKTHELTLIAQEDQMDIVYLAFEIGSEHLGPQSVSIFADRFGIIYRWLDCSVWAPKDSGPLLIMPGDDLNVCFAHDGKALISMPERPTKSLRNGVQRARNRLRNAARTVTEAQLSKVEEGLKRAA